MNRPLTRLSTLGLIAGASLGVAALTLMTARPISAETMKVVPPPTLDATEQSDATVVLAGGCFWGVQGVYQHVNGVTSAVAGYSGGSKVDPSYEVVSTGTTGHAESVRISYDPRQVSLGKLLQIYFSVVTDPTTLNAQGPDEGTQYRSAIFTTTAEQAKVAKSYIAQLQSAHAFAAPIVTTVTPFAHFYPAEGYHQNYLTLHPDSGYIAMNDMPKVEGLKTLFAKNYRSAPLMAAATE